VQVGDLVNHKGTGRKYLIVEAKPDGSGLVGIIREDGSLGFMSRNWLEVISEG